MVSSGGRGVVGQAGTRLLAGLADATRLTDRFGDALGSVRQRRRGHDPGRVAVDLAVMLADGGEAIADLVVLRNQPDLFGAVVSDATAWRVLAGIDSYALARLRSARAAVREVAWAQAIETRGGLPASRVAGGLVPGLVLDLDASIVVCHSEKESAAPTWLHLRVPPAVLLPGRHRGGAGRDPAARQRRVEHHRRPHHRAGPRAGADPRPVPTRHSD